MSSLKRNESTKSGREIWRNIEVAASRVREVNTQPKNPLGVDISDWRKMALSAVENLAARYASHCGLGASEWEAFIDIAIERINDIEVISKNNK